MLLRTESGCIKLKDYINSFLIFLFLSSNVVLAQKPELIIPSGQNSRIYVAKITPDGKYFLSGAMDRSIKVYDVKEKKEVFTFWKHKTGADDIAVAPDNRTVVSVATGNEILVWDLYTGKVLHEIESDCCSSYASIAIHPNGKTFLVAHGGNVAEFDLLSGKLLIEEKYHDIPINKIGYLKNGTEFYTSARHDSKIDSLRNFFQTRTIDKEIINEIFWNSASYQACAFSEDGNTRYDVTNVPEEVRIAHLDEKPIKIPIKDYVPFEVEVLSKNSLVITCRKDEKISFLIFNLTTLKIEKAIDTDSFYGAEFVDEFGGNFRLQVLPNTKDEIIFTTTLYDSKVFHTNLSTGITSEFIRTKTQLYYPQLLNGQFYLTGRQNNIKWDLFNNKITTIQLRKEGIGVTPLKNGIATQESNKKIFIWDTNLTKVKDSVVFDKTVFGLFSNQEGTKVILNLDGRPTFYEPQTGKVKDMDFIENWYGMEWLDESNLVFLSEIDEKQHLLFTSTEKVEKVIPIQFKEKVYLDGYHRFIVNRFNNTMLLAAGYEGTLQLISQEGKILVDRKISDRNCTFLEYNNKLQQIIASFANGEILFLNPETLEIITRLKGHQTEVHSVLLSEDYKKVFSSSLDNTIKVWDYEKSTLLSTLSVLDGKEWVIIHEDGLFDASPQAMKEIYYVVNDYTDTDDPWKIIELEQLKHRYYQPDLLQIQLGYNKETLRTPLAIKEIPLPPKVITNIRDNKLKVIVKNQKGGIGKVAFFIENAEISADLRPKGKADQDAKELIINIDLDTYKNRFTTIKDVSLKVIAWNKEEWIRSRPEIINYSPILSKGAIATSTSTKNTGEKTRLFGLIVGTSDYAGKQIDLNYAAKDAIDFANALRISSENLFDKENTTIELLNSESNDINQKPSRKNLLNALKELEAKIKPSDILLVYLSGHGVNYGGAEGDFYYLTQEASGADAAYLNDEGVRNSATISSTELTQLLNSITAKKKILILDACASGKAAEKMTVSKDVPASQIRALDRMQDRTGFYILAGSASDAVSYESSVYGQGLLTYSLLKAIKGSALREDGKEEYIDVQKMFQFAVDEVPELSKNIGGIQKPFFKSPDNQQSYDIGKVDLSTKNKIIISEPKPVFIEAVFSDSESLYDELGLSETFNANLQENAAKGKSADIAFMRVKEYAGAYRISGSYTQNADEIKLNYIVIQNKKPIQPISTIIISKKTPIQESINQIIETLKSKIN